MFIYLDLESLPNPDYGEIARPTTADLKCPKTLKKQETIDAWWASPEREDELEEIYQKRVNEFRKTALNPWECQVFCIAWAIEESGLIMDEEIKVIWGLDEKLLLEQFSDALQTGYEKKIVDKMSVSTFVGFNLRNFDNSVLRLKSIKHKLSWLTQVLPTRKYHDRIEDIMEMSLMTTRLTIDKYVGLDYVCKFFGMEGKGEIEGSNVYDHYLEGKYQEIADYCKDDVEKTRTLHKLMR